MIFVNLLLACVLTGMLIKWRSPLILFAAQFSFGSVFRTDDESFWINLSWFVALVAVGFAVRRTGLTIDRFSLDASRVGVMRSIAFVMVAVAALAFWVAEIGITELSSAKRLSEESGLGNIIDSFLLLLLTTASIVLAFGKRGIRKPLLVACIVVFALIALRAFLGSNRGLILVPVVFIVAVRALTISSRGELVRFLTFAVPLVPLALLLIAYVTAERAGVASDGGFALLIEQISSPLSNGYSPMKDQIIMNYVEYRGPLFPATMFLAPIYAFIPSLIWPDKPDVGAGRTVGFEVFGTGDEISGQGAGIPISIPAHFEAIIGQGGFAMGLLAIIVGSFLIAHLARRYPIVIVPLAIAGHGALGSDIGRLGLQMIIMTVGLLVIQRLMGFKLRLDTSIDDPDKSKRRPRAAPPAPRHRAIPQSRVRET